ncbi:MAG: STAS domain-containing protein [Alphaproteobacteria bacterium]|nr:STAS domain-containing protein [Alphaproteobacteria bacterium]
MEMRVEQLAEGVVLVAPTGRWDQDGSAEIAQKFIDAITPGLRVIVDMSGVPYLSSMGIRSLLMGANTARGKGGRMVLLSPNANVAGVLITAHISDIIPTFNNFETARRAVTA